MFTNFKIIPVSSCENVINSCKALNDLNYLNLNRRAYGIIDNDFHTSEEIAKYEQSKIFTLPYNEIENLLLSPIILDYICNKHELTDKLENFKTDIINMANRDKNGIIKDYINKTYPRLQKSGHILSDDIENIKNEIEQINTENTNNFIDAFNQFVSSLDTALSNRGYNEIICKYPNKGFVSCLKTLGITKEVYFQWINNSLSEDEIFRKNVINNFFGSFFD